MLEVLRTTVNTWECDQMGHLNVRYYLAHAHAGLSVLALHCGLTPQALRAREAHLRVRDQHLRFHKELRPGTPLCMKAAVLHASADRLRVLQELFSAKTTSSELAATVVSDVELTHGRECQALMLDPTFVERARELATVLPAHAAPRGVALEPPRRRPRREEAIDLGMTGAFLGPVSASDCDTYGRMHESAFMGRVADGIGHFFRSLHEGFRPEGIGGAALEYRYVFHARPRLGDVIEVRTGLKALGAKTLHMCHYIFDMADGSCVATSEAIAVSFDLHARKAVAIADPARAAMQRHVIAGISA